MTCGNQDLLSPPSERSEWRRYCFRLMCVCLCFCAQRTGQSDKSKTVKATDFKFDMHVPRVSPDTTPYKFFENGAWPGSHDPHNFWALNANSSKMVKATDFKFDCRPCFQGQSGHDPLKIFRQRVSVKIHLAEICTLASTF